MKTSILLTASENGRYLYIHLPAVFAGKSYALSVDPKDGTFAMIPNRRGVQGIEEGDRAKFFYTKCHHGLTKEQLEAFPKTLIAGDKDADSIVFKVPYFAPLPAKKKDPRSQAAQLIDGLNGLLATGDFEAAVENNRLALYRRELIKI